MALRSCFGHVSFWLLMYENMQKMILILKYTNVIIMMKIILADLNLQSVSAHMKHAEMHEITWSWNGKHIILLALIVELLNKKIPFYVIKIIIQKSSFVMLHWHWKWGPGFCVKYKNLIVITDLHHSITSTKYFCCCKYFGHNMLQNIISVVAILDHVDINSSPGSCVR